MATTSEIEVGMQTMAARLYADRQTMVKVKQNASASSVDLAAIPNDFADVIATVNAFGAGNAWEVAVKAKMVKMTAEFQALKTVADAVAAANLG